MDQTTEIRFVDLAAQNLEVRDEIEHELQTIHQQTSYTGGEQVARFEREFADFVGVRHAIGVGNGTDALRLALLASGVGPGDEVITVPMTFVATVAAIVQTGALPLFVDVDPRTGTMSPAALECYLAQCRSRSRNGPRAIVPVHLYGMPAAMPEIMRIAQEHGLAVIEDACQAHGARLLTSDGVRIAGSFGMAGCFSFYPGKNLGAWGDAGAVVTNDEELAERITRLRDHGRISHYAHEEFGYNSRLDSIQAAVLRAKLKRLKQWNRRRREIARAYRQMLAGTGLDFQQEPEGAESCYHLFVVRSERRDAIRQALMLNRIGCGIHYPVPIHLQPACRPFGFRQSEFPVSERIADTVVSLPMHPHLASSEIARVAEAVHGALLNLNGHGTMEDGAKSVRWRTESFQSHVPPSSRGG